MPALLGVAAVQSRTRRRPRTFTSQRERDLESALMHYRARSYDPRTGRFLQPDPIAHFATVATTESPFLYASARPVDRVDSTGMQVWTGLPEQSEEWKSVANRAEAIVRAKIPTMKGSVIRYGRDQLGVRRIMTPQGDVGFAVTSELPIFGPYKWTRMFRSAYYSGLLSRATFNIVRGNAVSGTVANTSRRGHTDIAAGAIAQTSPLNRALVLAQILLHELAHHAQFEGWEPVVASGSTKDTFGLSTLEQRHGELGKPDVGGAFFQAKLFTDVTKEAYAHYLALNSFSPGHRTIFEQSMTLKRALLLSDIYGVYRSGKVPQFDWSQARWRYDFNPEWLIEEGALKVPPPELLNMTKW